MINKIFKIILALSIGTSTVLQANTTNYNNSTINIPSSKNDKIFIREYTYHASDTDSKVSSRKKAIAQLKSILSEEVGVHIQSSFNIKQTSHNKYVKKEINQLSASITKLKILEEKWNGVTYYIKASVRINEKQTMLLLLEAIKAKSSQKDVKRLNKILEDKRNKINKKNQEILNLNKKLILQDFINEAKKDRSNAYLNIGFMINQKYICKKEKGILNNDNYNLQKILQFYINNNLILKINNGDSLTNIAPQIYKNNNLEITLKPINGNRFIFIKSNNYTTIMRCADTSTWRQKYK